MTIRGAERRDGTLVLRRAFHPAPVYTLALADKDTVCHVRGSDGEYLATLECDRMRGSTLLFNAYKGAVRVGTVAAAETASGSRAMPILTFSWGGRVYDGHTLTAPLWESDSKHRRELAAITKKPSGWTVRMRSGIAPGDECDAVLALAAVLLWRRAQGR